MSVCEPDWRLVFGQRTGLLSTCKRLPPLRVCAFFMCVDDGTYPSGRCFDLHVALLSHGRASDFAIYPTHCKARYPMLGLGSKECDESPTWHCFLHGERLPEGLNWTRWA